MILFLLCMLVFRIYVRFLRILLMVPVFCMRLILLSRRMMTIRVCLLVRITLLFIGRAGLSLSVWRRGVLFRILTLLLRCVRLLIFLMMLRLRWRVGLLMSRASV